MPYCEHKKNEKREVFWNSPPYSKAKKHGFEKKVFTLQNESSNTISEERSEENDDGDDDEDGDKSVCESANNWTRETLIRH